MFQSVTTGPEDLRAGAAGGMRTANVPGLRVAREGDSAETDLREQKRSEESRSQLGCHAPFLPKALPGPPAAWKGAPRAPHLTASEVSTCGPPASCLAHGFPASQRGPCWSPAPPLALTLGPASRHQATPPPAAPPLPLRPRVPRVFRTMSGPVVKGQDPWPRGRPGPWPPPCTLRPAYPTPRTSPGGRREVSRITECSL